LRVERWRRIAHVESVLAEAQNVPTDVGAGAGEQVGRDCVSVRGHARQDCGHIDDIGQHDRGGDQAGVFELLLLLKGIAALDHRATERNPVEELVVGFDLGGFGADDAANFGVGDVECDAVDGRSN
jgi:hypothetical protein